MYSSEKRTKDGRALLIREGRRSVAGAVLEYVRLISRESDFLTFGPGEFRFTEKEEDDYLEKSRCTENCLFLLALLQEETVVGALSFEAGACPRIRHAGELSVST